ncbi:TraB/GumN family protein [Asticcacaulis solisilvae]|uniref:TraB/GumN family protein n=1 Tax=Asticcacaulis solisilvae TaxID=1217274 RepID=UPI003FD75294
MIKKAWMAATLCAVLIAGNASAQTGAPAQPDDRWSGSAEVVVHARLDGCPAMWRLRYHNATVWVMPTLMTETRHMRWQESCFEHVLKSAHTLFLQSEYVSVQSDPRSLPWGVTVKDVVSPATWDRFVAAVNRQHRSLGRLQKLHPSWAAYDLVGSAYSRLDLVNESFPSDMLRLAHSAGTSTRYVPLFVGSFDQRNIRNELDPAGEEACLNSMLDRVDFTLDDLPTVIRAWQASDIPTVLKLWPAEDNRCVPADRIESDFILRENARRWTAVIADALGTPGKKVAAVPLGWLLYKGGVLDQLTQSGVEVTAPAGLDD